MNLKQLKDSGLIIYEVVVGSHLYGTNKEGSDTDIKGIYIQPTSEILAGRYIPQISDEKQDTTYYEIGRFIELISDANPNMLDILGSDKILYDNGIFREYFPDNTIYLTSNIKHKFSGYAFSQIQKAKGYNKKVNWEKSRIERKTPLDFCYVLDSTTKYQPREGSLKFLEAYGNNIKFINSLGLASVNNFPDIYSMYIIGEGGGIVSENSNDVQLRSIPKNAHFLGYMRFDRNAYSTHCKNYREYTKWLEDRNPLRYRDNNKVDNTFDTKNMMHCIRLLNTSIDLLSGKGLILSRPEKDYLLDIRNGKVSYDTIIKEAEEKMDYINKLYDTTALPREVNKKYIQELLLKIRLDNLNK